jgi:hypothetical protein
LRRLAGGADRVKQFSLKKTLAGELPHPRMLSIAIGDASTTKSLCGHHDSALFSKIDRPLGSPSREQLFLLAYRSVIHDLHVANRSLWRAENLARLGAPVGFVVPTVKKALREIVQCLAATRSHVQWLKDRFDKIYLAGAPWAGLDFITRVVPVSLPIAASGTFVPALDFHGNPLPWHAAAHSLGHVRPRLCLNVVPEDKATLISLCIPDEFECGVRPLLVHLRSIAEDVLFVDAIWEVLQSYCENFFLAPRFWDLIPKSTQQAVEAFFEATTRNPMIRPGIALPPFSQLFGKW